MRLPRQVADLARIVSILTNTPRKDPRRARPGQVVQLLNSTPVGEVVNDRMLRGWRSAAGSRVGDAKTVDILRLIAWLVTRYHLPKPEHVVRSAREVATHFKVTERVVREQWMRNDDFPGRASRPGKRDGEFHLDKIESWLRNRQAETGRESKAIAGAGIETQEQAVASQLRAIKLAREQLALDVELGKYLPKEDTLREIMRCHAIAIQFLVPLPQNMLAIMPHDTPEQLKVDFLALAEDVVRKALDSIADSIQKDSP